MLDALLVATISMAAVVFAAVVILFPVAGKISGLLSAMIDGLGRAWRRWTGPGPGTGGGDYFASSRTYWQQLFGIEMPPASGQLSGGYVVYGRFMAWALGFAVLTIAPELRELFLPNAWDWVKASAYYASYAGIAGGLMFLGLVFAAAWIDEEDAVTRTPARMRRIAESRARAMAGEDDGNAHIPFFRVRYAAGVAAAAAFSILTLNALQRDFNIYGQAVSAWQYATDVASALIRNVPLFGGQLAAWVESGFAATKLPGFGDISVQVVAATIYQLFGLTLALLFVFVVRRFFVDIYNTFALVRLEDAVKSSDDSVYADKTGRIQDLEGKLDRAADDLKTVKAEQPNNKDDITKRTREIAALKQEIAAAKEDLGAQTQNALERRYDIDKVVAASRQVIGAGPGATMDGVARLEALLQHHKADSGAPGVVLRRLRQAGFVNKSVLALGLLSTARDVPRLQQRAHGTLIHALTGAIQEIVGEEWPPIVLAFQGTPSTAGIDKEQLLKNLREFCDRTNPSDGPSHWSSFTDLLAVVLSELPQSHWGVEASEAIDRLKEAVDVVSRNIGVWWGRSPDLATVHHNLGMARLVVARQSALTGRAADHVIFAREAVDSFEAALELRDPSRGGLPGGIFQGRNQGAQARAAYGASLNGFGHACAMLARATLNENWGREAIEAFEEALAEWDELRREMAGDPQFVTQNISATLVHLASVAATLGMHRYAEKCYHNAAAQAGGLQPIHAFNANVRRILCLVQGGVAASGGWLDAKADNAPGLASGRLRLAQSFFNAAFGQIEKTEAQYVKSAQTPVRRPRLFLDGRRPQMAMLFLVKGLAYAASCQAFPAKAPEFLILGARFIDHGLRFDLAAGIVNAQPKALDAKSLGETWLTATRSHMTELQTLAARAPAGGQSPDAENTVVFVDMAGPTDETKQKSGRIRRRR